jgi:hypothetical protein
LPSPTGIKNHTRFGKRSAFFGILFLKMETNGKFENRVRPRVYSGKITTGFGNARQSSALQSLRRVTTQFSPQLMRKVAAANLLSHRIGEIFDGIVTGASPKGTYARLLKMPAEGRIIQGTQGLDVGDKISVRLASVDVAKGFIDFARQAGGK